MPGRLDALGDDAGDGGYNYSPFWDERNYRDHARRIHTSVFMVQGLTDPKVMGREFFTWWSELAARGIPRKLWLHNAGHVDPVAVRPGVWQETLHQWMDYWLYGIRNGIMNRPMVDIQRQDGSWHTDSTWPPAGTHSVRFSFGPAVPGAAGTLGRSPERRGSSQSFTDDPAQREGTMLTSPGTALPHRLAYLSAPLTRAVRISGTPHLDVIASADSTSTPLTALLVDYGPGALGNAAGGGGGRGGGGGNPVPVVSRGSIDAKNRFSLAFDVPLHPGQPFAIHWDMHATDYVWIEQMPAETEGV